MNVQSAQLYELTDDKAKENGVVYTPQEVADEITRFVAKGVKAHSIRILEPSCGDGAFVRSIRDVFPNAILDAIDIDPDAIAACRAANAGVPFECADFFSRAFDDSSPAYDLVIGNPPYIRSSNFSAVLKEQLASIADELCYPRSQLRNSWPGFVLACARLLKPSGKLAFVVPYELINVSYGQSLIERMLQEFERIDVFVPDEKAFTQIDQDAVLLLGSKKTTTSGGLHLNKVSSLKCLNTTRTSKVPATTSSSNSTDMKSFLLEPDQLELLHKVRSSIGKIGDVCTSAAGTVTAANSFFILSLQDVEKLGLVHFAKPIIQKASYIPHSSSFSEADFESLQETGKPCFLIDFSGIPTAELSKNAKNYIAYGESLNLNTRYKCRHRTPWYKVPIVPSTDGFFFKRSHLLPRICSNTASVLTTDTAYQIRMSADRSIDDLCVSFYNLLTLLFSEIDGRFYGGGVLELTPREFRGLPMLMLKSTAAQRKKLENLADQSRIKHTDLFRLADNAVRRHLNLDDGQWNRLQVAHTTIRNHRFRHGSKPTSSNLSLRAIA